MTTPGTSDGPAHMLDAAVVGVAVMLLMQTGVLQFVDAGKAGVGWQCLTLLVQLWLCTPPWAAHSLCCFSGTRCHTAVVISEGVPVDKTVCGVPCQSCLPTIHSTQCCYAGLHHPF